MTPSICVLLPFHGIQLFASLFVCPPLPSVLTPTLHPYSFCLTLRAWMLYPLAVVAISVLFSNRRLHRCKSSPSSGIYHRRPFPVPACDHWNIGGWPDARTHPGGRDPRREHRVQVPLWDIGGIEVRCCLQSPLIFAPPPRHWSLTPRPLSRLNWPCTTPPCRRVLSQAVVCAHLGHICMLQVPPAPHLRRVDHCRRLPAGGNHYRQLHGTKVAAVRRRKVHPAVSRALYYDST